MKIKTVKNLQIFAFALFTLELLTCIVLTFAQAPIKRMFSLPEEVLNSFDIPFSSMIVAVIHVVFALISMLVVTRCPSRDQIKVRAIIITILFILVETLVLPLTNTFIAKFVFLRGVTAYASYAALVNVLGEINTLLCVPAKALMFLSIGGSFGINPTLEKQQAVFDADSKTN